MKLTYTQQLAHPQWQRRRLEMLQAADWECAKCFDKEATLHVHHRQYFKGRMAWEYSDKELVVLCADCHQLEHVSAENLKRLLTMIPIDHCDIDDAIALLAGYYSPHVPEIEGLFLEVALNPSLASIGFIAEAMKGLTTKQLCKVNELVEALQGERRADSPVDEVPL